jgi:hypothetical protein
MASLPSEEEFVRRYTAKFGDHLEDVGIQSYEAALQSLSSVEEQVDKLQSQLNKAILLRSKLIFDINNP